MVFGHKTLLSGATALLSLANFARASPAPLKPRNGDSCTEIYNLWHEKGEQYIDAELAYNCLTAVPYDAKRSAYIAKQMRLFTQIYSAQAFFYKPPTPELRIKAVDLNGTFDDIEKKCTKSDGYANDYEFQTSIMKLYGSFHDGHVMYMPRCATEFLFYHDYPLVAIYKDGEDVPLIYIGDRETGEVKEQVVEIDGQDVYDYLINMSLELPDLGWIDHDARFNDLLMTKHPVDGLYPGYFALSSYHRGTGFSIKLADGKQIDVKWKAMVKYEPSYQNADEYLQKVCLDPNYAGIENTKLRTRDIRERDAELKPRIFERPPEQRMKLRKKAPEVDTPLETRSIYDQPPIPWPKLDLWMPGFEMTLKFLNNQTAVWGIHAFADQAGSSGFFKQWADFVTKAFAAFKKYNTKHLIIDVSGNGGGYVSLGIVTLRYIFPEAAPFYGFDLRRSPALDLLIEKSADSDSSHLSLNATKDINNQDFKSIQDFLGPVYKYGDYFTNIGRWDVTDAIEDIGLTDPGNTTKAIFTADNIVLLSDGRCGSTCAIFGEGISNLHVKSVSYGGIPDEKAGDKKMQHVGGIKGSQVWDWDTFMEAHVEPFIPNPEQYDFLPRRLPINHYSRVNLRNSYEPGSDLPLEFTWQPGNAHLYITKEMWEDREVLWNAVEAMTWDADGKNILPESDVAQGSGGGKKKPGDDGEEQEDTNGETDSDKNDDPKIVSITAKNWGDYIAAMFPNHRWGVNFDLSEFGIYY